MGYYGGKNMVKRRGKCVQMDGLVGYIL